MIKSRQQWGANMDNLAWIVVAAAFVVGFFLGWIIGRRTKMIAVSKDMKRDEHFRENAQVDFEFVRSKAHDIVRLANEIAKRATDAHDTVLDPHAHVGQRPSLPDEPGMQKFTRPVA
jgi:uncharacterized membrane-anchored protein YhcB (DUF1043 family)